MAISVTDKEYISDKLNRNLFYLRNSNIFITGATGFFGKWLLETLMHFNSHLGLNINIYALSRSPENFLRQFPYYKNEKINWLKGDIRSFEFPYVKCEYIIHAATDSDAKLNSESPLIMLDTINEGTRRVLEFARNKPELKSLLFTSSGAIYGQQPYSISKIKETDSFHIDLNNPGSAYAEGKRLAELCCSIYTKHYNVPVVIARCFAFVGPHLPLNKHFAIGNFINDGLNVRNITISGDGTPQRSYMYAADLMVWLLTLLLEGKSGDAYNVGSDTPISIYELALKIADLFPGISVIKLNQNKSTDRNQNYVPDVSQFKNKFGIYQNIDLDSAVKKTIEYYQKTMI